MDNPTPLSATVIETSSDEQSDTAASGDIQQEAEIIRAQSAKIKDLVKDLNLVSQLEYEMQPLHKEPVRLSKLLRSYAADLLNAGIGEKPRNFSADIPTPLSATVIETFSDEQSRDRKISHPCGLWLMLFCTKLPIAREINRASHSEGIDSRAFSDFCGVKSGNQVPAGDTLGRF